MTIFIQLLIELGLLFEARPPFSSSLSLFGGRTPVLLTGKWAPLSLHLSLSLSISLSVFSPQTLQKMHFSILEVSTWASCPTQLHITANREVAAGLVGMQASRLRDVITQAPRDQERFHLAFPVRSESIETDPLVLQKETSSAYVPDLKQGPNLETVLEGELHSLCHWLFLLEDVVSSEHQILGKSSLPLWPRTGSLESSAQWPIPFPVGRNTCALRLPKPSSFCHPLWLQKAPLFSLFFQSSHRTQVRVRSVPFGGSQSLIFALFGAISKVPLCFSQVLHLILSLYGPS